MKTNEWANEYNYMLDVFTSIKEAYFPEGQKTPKDDQKGWEALFK